MRPPWSCHFIRPLNHRPQSNRNLDNTRIDRHTQELTKDLLQISTNITTGLWKQRSFRLASLKPDEVCPIHAEWRKLEFPRFETYFEAMRLLYRHKRSCREGSGRSNKIIRAPSTFVQLEPQTDGKAELSTYSSLSVSNMPTQVCWRCMCL